MQTIRDLLKSDSIGGILLFTAGFIALLLANSPWKHWYELFLHTQLMIQIGLFSLAKPLVLWINDGFMALFFLLVGLEIKREPYKGVFKKIDKMILPTVGALGGLIVPALVYYAFNHGDELAMNGWAIPTATDIAFSLGILSLLGSRVPVSLKIFLTALAILDDIAAIIIIAIFYASELSLVSLFFSGLAIIVLIAMNSSGVKRLSPYCLVGIVLWVSVLYSGVHATLAGVVLAFAIPLDAKRRGERSPLYTLEQALVPWVTLFILPLFAFANSGFSVEGLSLSYLLKPIPLAIAAGLFIGKQVGIFSICWISIKLKWARLPQDINFLQLYGIALLCGVGFTMSLFIGSLAFVDHELHRMVRMGILVGSTLSGVAGYSLLAWSTRR